MLVGINTVFFMCTEKYCHVWPCWQCHKTFIQMSTSSKSQVNFYVLYVEIQFILDIQFFCINKSLLYISQMTKLSRSTYGAFALDIRITTNTNGWQVYVYSFGCYFKSSTVYFLLFDIF